MTFWSFAQTKHISLRLALKLWFVLLKKEQNLKLVRCDISVQVRVSLSAASSEMGRKVRRQTHFIYLDGWIYSFFLIAVDIGSNVKEILMEKKGKKGDFHGREPFLPLNLYYS